MTAATPSPTVANGSVATQRPSSTSGSVGEGRGPVDPLIAQLRDLRIKAGLTQAQVAEASGTSQQHLSQVENGRQQPSLGWLRSVAQVIGWQPGPLVPLAYDSTWTPAKPGDTPGALEHGEGDAPPVDSVSLIAAPGRPLRPGEFNLGDVPPTLNPDAVRDAYGLGPHPTTPRRGNNPWAFCACGHAWINHDVDEYVGDDSDTCCVEGCDQAGCPGKAVARTLDVAEQTAAMAREAGR